MISANDFKSIYNRFQKALKYILDNEVQLRKDVNRWDKIQKNFINKFEKPLDEAWNNLSEEDKNRFATLYLWRKVEQDKTIKKILNIFPGSKIVKVGYGENEKNNKPVIMHNRKT